MPAPAFFIVWGTKVRNNHLGYCADFCTGCLQITTNELHSIESAPHFYYFPGEFVEQTRYLECAACGGRRTCNSTVETHFTKHPLPVLMERARPPFSPADLKHLAQDISRVPREARDQRRMACFSETQTQNLNQLNESNLMWIIFYVMVVAAIGGLFYVNESNLGAGITVAIGVPGLIGLIYWRLFHNAGKLVLPAWQRFERGCCISLPDLQRFLDAHREYSRLRGILKQSRFDTYRFEAGSRVPDRDIAIDIVDFA